MKFLVPLLVLGLIFTSCKKDTNLVIPPPEKCEFVDFKYYQNEPYFLGEMSNNYISLGFDSVLSNDSISSFINSWPTISETDLAKFPLNSSNNPYKTVIVKLNSTMECLKIQNVLNTLENEPSIKYANFTFKTEDCQSPIGQPLGSKCVDYMGNSFSVRLHSANDKAKLDSIVNITNTRILFQYSSGSYSVLADKHSNGNALQMANRFHETNLFRWAEPGLGKIPVE